MILVTGGNGCIGRNICAALQTRHEVVALDKTRPDSRVERNFAPMVQCDLSDEDALAAVFAAHSIDTIVHLAAVAQTLLNLDETITKS